MSAESNFSFTTKVEGDLLTIRGDSPDEFIKNLVSLGTVPAVANLVSIIDGVAAVQAVFPGSTVIESPQPTPVAPAQPFAPVAPPPSAAPATPTGPVCKHGAMTHRTGTNKANGNSWSGWFCPSPKGTPDQCSPQFSK